MLQLNNLTKIYEGKKALDDITLEIPDGKIYGILGANGAGKTTMMKIIANRAFPTDGEVLLDGVNVTENEFVQGEIFYVTEKDRYPKDIKMKDLLVWESRFFARFDLAYAKSLAAKFDLDLNKKTNSLSTGYYTIFKVIVSLASNAKIMILDEPVLGIDSLYRELFYEVLNEYHQTHKNLILISTHLIDEVEPVLEEVLIINRGKILRQGSLAEIAQGDSLNKAYVKILKEASHG
ncbi:ABC transporter ATP-binding protein [Enterococcus pingfangensis]